MKSRFTSIDILAIVCEIREKYLGYRLINTYDIDSKTYLFKLSKTSEDDKVVLLIESGIRIHTTDFEWPKNLLPSGFSMKMRKHLRNKRLEDIQQLGIDRIVDLYFGSGAYAFHVILELYDRGNMILTDHEYTILNILRPRTDKDQDVKYATRERYPIELARGPWQLPNNIPLEMETHWDGPVLPIHRQLVATVRRAKSGEMLRRVVTILFEYGPQVLEHCVKEMESSGILTLPLLQMKIGRDIILPNVTETNVPLAESVDAEHVQTDLIVSQLMREASWFPQLLRVFQYARDWVNQIVTDGSFLGIITYKVESPSDNKSSTISTMQSEKSDEITEVISFLEYHPFMFHQLHGKPCREYPSFNKAVDEFYSQLETQKQDMKALQQEKAALKKFENVKRDHEKRIEDLKSLQDVDKIKGQYIEMNLALVDQAIVIINHALANQVDWTEIDNLLTDAREDDSEVAKAITKLKLATNHISMSLRDPYEIDNPNMDVDIDLGMTAFANAKKYFDLKRTAENKEQKTLSASQKALKSAEAKTKQMLKEVYIAAKINKIRKPMWFEKFLWFISSENYVVVGGRDQQQNEILVKRYLKPGDIYVHADLRGASSVIVKNHKSAERPDLPKEIPPKTLNEAGQMAVVYSSGWTARVVTAAYWVYHDQVSKTAPTGEYLTTGSFMIRGRKNYLQPCHLQFGFGLLFKMSDDSMARHVGERRIRYEEGSQQVNEAISEEGFVEIDSEGSSGSESQDEGKESVEKNGLSKKENEIKEHEKVEDEVSGSSSGSEESDSDSSNEFPDAQIAVDLTKITAKKQRSSDSTSKLLGEIKPFSGFLTTTTSLSTSSTQSVPSTDKGEPNPRWEEATPQATTKPRISAKQRRLMKKSVNGVTNDSETTNSMENQKNETSNTIQLKVECLAPELNNPVTKPQTDSAGKQGPLKRGQRSRLKKMKEKYKDQDEEDRMLRMALLQQPEMTKGKTKKRLKQEKVKQLQEQKQALQDNYSQNQKQPKPGSAKKTVKLANIPESGECGDTTKQENELGEVKVTKEHLSSGEEEVDDDEEDELKAPQGGSEETTQSSIHLADTLTGCPMIDDELYYALPVCAPYPTLSQYKFKVKITPGNTKRGKACKTALGCFLADKTCSAREKDLIRALKDQEISRNFPGKVKVSAPNLLKSKSAKIL